jgi:oxygen-independent coproporphyrinogen-3 oxidase
MTSLRTIEGIDLKLIENNFSINHRKRIENTANDYIERKLIIIKNENFVLTEEGKLFADGIAADLFA